ncbi:DUF4031 domain-containing protein [Paracoccus litorisediminis]|uniref:DUF4031 domain-containing protein n=1 Tax=Paracoccus litorisediminis TaxID=2006130 RepID=UPI0037327F71
MSVYVDDMRASVGRMRMCHMMADTTDELIAMADLIGVERRWLQYGGTIREHFDIAMSKRAAAIREGAIKVSSRDLGHLMRMRSGRRFDPTSPACQQRPAIAIQAQGKLPPD